jgi:hypothetical protein
MCYIHLYFRAKWTEFWRPLLKDKNYWEKQTLDEDFHGIVSGTTEKLSEINRLGRRSISSLRMMKQKLGVFPESFAMPRNHFLIESFDSVIGRMLSGGLIDYWRFRNVQPDKKIDDFGPEVLTMEHLGVCFLVCMIPFVFAIIAFIFEQIWYHRKKFKRVNDVNIRQKLSIVKKPEKTDDNVKKTLPTILVVKPYNGKDSNVIDLSVNTNEIETCETETSSTLNACIEKST